MFNPETFIFLQTRWKFLYTPNKEMFCHFFSFSFDGHGFRWRTRTRDKDSDWDMDHEIWVSMGRKYLPGPHMNRHKLLRHQIFVFANLLAKNVLPSCWLCWLGVSVVVVTADMMSKFYVVSVCADTYGTYLVKFYRKIQRCGLWSVKGTVSQACRQYLCA